MMFTTRPRSVPWVIVLVTNRLFLRKLNRFVILSEYICIISIMICFNMSFFLHFTASSLNMFILELNYEKLKPSTCRTTWANLLRDKLRVRWKTNNKAKIFCNKFLQPATRFLLRDKLITQGEKRDSSTQNNKLRIFVSRIAYFAAPRNCLIYINLRYVSCACQTSTNSVLSSLAFHCANYFDAVSCKTWKWSSIRHWCLIRDLRCEAFVDYAFRESVWKFIYPNVLAIADLILW